MCFVCTFAVLTGAAAAVTGGSYIKFIYLLGCSLFHLLNLRVLCVCLFVCVFVYVKKCWTKCRILSSLWTDEQTIERKKNTHTHSHKIDAKKRRRARRVCNCGWAMIRSANNEMKRNIHILVLVSTHAQQANCTNRNFFCYTFALYLSIARWADARARISCWLTWHEYAQQASKNLAKMFQLCLLSATTKHFTADFSLFPFISGMPL